MIYFVMWLSTSGFWFKGPEYASQQQCEMVAQKVRATVPNAQVLCSPRGLP